ncbi:Putative zinc-or iron-chelating domain-containing protein [Desulfacinum hydrothermale DSM 13146]|uniref:Putative zinc-or iron-chelating domain-containing protein n=1 Tax=Desulfacinum hydrothermale DSM 13146 TaxID=1121390 RepID=A0A1W1WYC8_9BACT|nr:YkgJ family cysteine cluster protein [Desulfacinum hydrothermale]SMC16654.1 Putative zinc-or iron-chelating domain-containing protein [Desulfacinum hydrothermale DSM 13146]
MRLDDKLKKLERIYQEFETKAADYVRRAVCGPGCAECCTNVGEIAVTTLEAYRIWLFLQGLSVFQRQAMAKKIEANREEKRRTLLLPCPFLDPHRMCSIYDVRPFSCRRLYSVEPCARRGPVVHKNLWQLAEETTLAIQKLDETGYAGHLSAVLALLDDPCFRDDYLNGRFRPDLLMERLRLDDLMINRAVGR